MASMRFTGAALDVKDVWALVIGGTWAAGDYILLTVGTRDLKITVGATTTTASIAAAISEAWNGTTASGDATRSADGSDIPEYAEATASVSSSTVTVTGDTAGVPVTLSRTISSASGTATLTHTTPATGAEWWDNADNWSGGAAPATGDVVYLDNFSGDIRYGLAQSGVTLAALYAAQTFTGEVGLPARSDNGYPEYRATYLAIGATAVQIGAGPGNGSGRFKLDTGSVQTTLTVVATGSPADADLPAVLWKGTHAGNALSMRDGSFGAAVYGGEAATLASWTLDGGTLLLGAGVTLSGALVVNGGQAGINSAVAGSLATYGGSAVIDGSGAVAGLAVRGGSVAYNTSGALGGAPVVSGDGVLDFSGDPRAVTVTNGAIDLYGRDCSLNDPWKRLGDFAVDLNEGAGLNQLNLGTNLRVSRAATA